MDPARLDLAEVADLRRRIADYEAPGSGRFTRAGLLAYAGKVR